jgi:hypothetical protein
VCVDVCSSIHVGLCVLVCMYTVVRGSMHAHQQRAKHLSMTLMKFKTVSTRNVCMCVYVKRYMYANVHDVLHITHTCV